MGLPRLLTVITLVLMLGGAAMAQSQRYGIGTPSTPEELRTWDISIGPTGEELPPGRGTAKEGAQVYAAKGCVACHGAGGTGGRAPILKAPPATTSDIWERPRVLPLRSPYATTVWDYINRAMPLNRERTLTPNEVYSLTAFLLYINDVIPEDQVVDQQSLPKIKMPIGDNWAPLPDWKPNTRRLKGYPF
jgi:cytochrome c